MNDENLKKSPYEILVSVLHDHCIEPLSSNDFIVYPDSKSVFTTSELQAFSYLNRRFGFRYYIGIRFDKLFCRIFR